MVTTYKSGLDTKEKLLEFMRYSVPLYVKNEEDEIGESISDLLGGDDIKEQNIKTHNDDNSSQSKNDINENYQNTSSIYPFYSLIGAYLDRRIESMHDFTDRVPGKNLETFPVAGNEGLYGYTFLGDVKAWRRDDLTGDFAKMVDVHECIHTPDEYETRRITEWMMEKTTTKYFK